MAESFRPRVWLSLREHQVLRLLATGLTTAEIAEHLGVAPSSVAEHARRLRRKLGARTRAHAVACACALRLLDVRQVTALAVQPRARGEVA